MSDPGAATDPGEQPSRPVLSQEPSTGSPLGTIGLAHDLQAREQAARAARRASLAESAGSRIGDDEQEDQQSGPPPQWLHRRHAGAASRGLAFLIDLALVATTITLFIYLTGATLRIMSLSVDECPAWVSVASIGDVISNLCWAIRGITAILSLAIAPIYLYTLWLLGGQTVGMMVAGVRVVRTNGRPLRPRHALLRLAGLAVSLLALGVGLLWAIVDRNRQGWHDRLAGTYVVYWRRDIAHKETHGSSLERSAVRAPDDEPQI